MSGLVFLGLAFVGLVGCVIAGHLGRIAAAVEAQNRHYRIGDETSTKQEAA